MCTQQNYRPKKRAKLAQKRCFIPPKFALLSQGKFFWPLNFHIVGLVISRALEVMASPWRRQNGRIWAGSQPTLAYPRSQRNFGSSIRRGFRVTDAPQQPLLLAISHVWTPQLCRSDGQLFLHWPLFGRPVLGVRVESVWSLPGSTVLQCWIKSQCETNAYVFIVSYSHFVR